MKNPIQKFKNEEGLSLLEVMAAVVVLAIVASGLIALGITAVRRSDTAKSKTTAFGLLKEGIEATRMIRDNINNYNHVQGDIWGVESPTAGTWNPWTWSNQSSQTYYYYLEKQGSGWKLNYRSAADCDNNAGDPAKDCYKLATQIDNITYYRQVKITDVTVGTAKKAIIVVGWYEGKKFKTASSATILTSWQ